MVLVNHVKPQLWGDDFLKSSESVVGFALDEEECTVDDGVHVSGNCVQVTIPNIFAYPLLSTKQQMGLAMGSTRPGFTMEVGYSAVGVPLGIRFFLSRFNNLFQLGHQEADKALSDPQHFLHQNLQEAAALTRLILGSDASEVVTSHRVLNTLVQSVLGEVGKFADAQDLPLMFTGSDLDRLRLTSPLWRGTDTVNYRQLFCFLAGWTLPYSAPELALIAEGQVQTNGRIWGDCRMHPFSLPYVMFSHHLRRACETSSLDNRLCQVAADLLKKGLITAKDLHIIVNSQLCGTQQKALQRHAKAHIVMLKL